MEQKPHGDNCKCATCVIFDAAKQLEAVTKERDELKEQIVPGFFGRMAAKKSTELNLLKADYKQALEALNCVMDDYSSLRTGKYESSRVALKAISLPSAIAIMKGEV